MVARSALLTVLVLVGGAQDAIAQSICFPIRVGDTAAQMAGRLTGDTQNRHAPWFQIVDQAWRPVSKIDYDVIHPGWLVCLAEGRPSTAPAGSSGRSAVVAGDLTFVWVASLIVGALSVSRFAVSYWRQRRERAHIMRRFGGEFVREFGRPLTQFRGNSPLPRARLRISARRSRLEILVAPADGRSYPNLSDHRSNVEYDVARVMAALGRESFANGRPYAEGQWVVLPFHYKGAVRQEGIR
jgi:hypothetical protein